MQFFPIASQIQGFEDSWVTRRLYTCSKFFIDLLIFVDLIFSVKMWESTSVGILFTILQWDRAPFVLSIYLPPFCFIVCKENVFCHIHELQISFSWTGGTDSSSSSSQQSIIPLLSHCLSFMFLSYLLFSPLFMGKAAWNTSWQLHSAVDLCIGLLFKHL